MTTDFPTAPLAPGHKGAGGGTVEKSLSASHTEILTPPVQPLLTVAPDQNLDRIEDQSSLSRLPTIAGAIRGVALLIWQ